jgi:hypothetical protein
VKVWLFSVCREYSMDILIETRIPNNEREELRISNRKSKLSPDILILMYVSHGHLNLSSTGPKSSSIKLETSGCEYSFPFALILVNTLLCTNSLLLSPG